ncbi:hypothetical protein HKX48_003931 [Thoreauomyces humboldtii]|nr:hypothetical protein HKX48_003931 [Thoreauomyces humboldtii]
MTTPLPSPPHTQKEFSLPSYDQYGFQRSDTHTPLHEQRAFDEHYHGVCERRRAKWVDWLAKHGGSEDRPLVPPRSDKAKRYVRKGVPHHLRKHVWLEYSGGRALMDNELGLYTLLCCREEQDIAAGFTKETNTIFQHISSLDRDVYRTFPTNIKFRPHQSTEPSPQFARPDSRAESIASSNATGASGPSVDVSESSFRDSGSDHSKYNASGPLRIHFETNPYLLSLRRILVAFAYYSWPHPSTDRISLRQSKYAIGYCQSLNYLVALLLLVFAENDADFELSDEMARLQVEERVFWTLVAVVEDLLPEEMFGETLQGARVQSSVLWDYVIGKNGAKFGLDKLETWLEHGSTMPKISSKASFPKLRRTRTGLEKGLTTGPAGGGGTPLSLITTQWGMTLFVMSLPPHTLLRLWDAFLYQGEKVFYRFTLTLLAMHQKRLVSLSLADLSAWRYIKNLPHQCYDVCAIDQTFRSKLPHHAYGSEQKGRRRPLHRNEVVGSPITPTEASDEATRWETDDLVRGVGSVSRKLIGRYTDWVTMASVRASSGR